MAKTPGGMLLLVLAVVTGCTHRQLRQNTIHVAASINEIHQQQVLDNLAMFVANPYALPHFSLPGSGTSQVNDVARLDTPFGLGRFTPASVFGLATLGINPSVSRTAQESWGVAPVNDPRKLELMRCAYQRAVAQCGLGVESGECPDCQRLWNKFYTGDQDKPVETEKLGIVTGECLYSGCWFRVGCSKCVPRHAKCAPVGEYCGLYVWVPESGRDEFTKLTLTILDIAFNSPPATVRALKEVTYYLDNDGKPVIEFEATHKITASIPLDRHNDLALKSAYLSELDALLERHRLTRAALGNLSLEGWSSQDVARLQRLADYLGLGVFYKGDTLLQVPRDVLQGFDEATEPIEVLPAPSADAHPAGDLLQLQRELNRVTIPQP